MKAGERGQIRIIEAFLATIIVFLSLAVSANVTLTSYSKRYEDLVFVGLQALMKLDSDGSLGEYVSNGNWSALREALNVVLPMGVCFNLTVYDEQRQQINDEIISNGAFYGQEITFVEYVCVTQSAVFRCYIIHMHLMVAS
ncbi:MAG: hypothetical protein QW667_07760 [Candidatus Bathyarchaeia archaeon]